MARDLLVGNLNSLTLATARASVRPRWNARRYARVAARIDATRISGASKSSFDRRLDCWYRYPFGCAARGLCARQERPATVGRALSSLSAFEPRPPHASVQGGRGRSIDAPRARTSDGGSDFES